jgi:tyrosyl-tRNA synthetase
MFQQKQVPDEMDEYHLEPGQSILDVLVASGLVKGRGEGRRLIDQKGVRLDGEVIPDALAAFPHPGVLQVGKRHFIRVV